MHAMGPGNVVVTGGHSDEGTDYFFDGETIEPIPGPGTRAGATHGSGCTHSSALAAHMALGMGALEAAREARRDRRRGRRRRAPRPRIGARARGRPRDRQAPPVIIGIA